MFQRAGLEKEENDAGQANVGSNQRLTSFWAFCSVMDITLFPNSHQRWECCYFSVPVFSFCLRP
jgi:hypothetical protein